MVVQIGSLSGSVWQISERHEDVNWELFQGVLHFLGTIIGYLWVAYLAYIGIQYAWKNRDYIDAYKKLDWLLFLLVFPLPIMVVAIYYGLYTLSPDIFGFSWIAAVSQLFGGKGTATNINFAGTDIKYLGVFMCLLLFIQLPSLARWEENTFRRGTVGWLPRKVLITGGNRKSRLYWRWYHSGGIVRSITFGLVHLAAGVPLGAAIGLIIPGLFFTELYFRGGINRSTQAHFQYNVLVTLVVLIFAISISLS